MSFSLLSTLLPLLLGPALTVLPNVGVTLPNAAPPDPAAEAARFEAVSKQLDPGGVLHAYVSVDGDLSAIGAYVKSFMDDMRPLASDVPHVHVPALLKISGLDAVSAVGMSSRRTVDGFRNKFYVHAPNGRKGLLRVMAGDSKPFEVLNLAPSGTDLVIEQDLNLKTLYEAVLEGAVVQMGEQGKAMVQMQVKQPLPPPFTFTLEKVLADLDTQVTIIIDADPTKMVNIPDAPKELKMPQLSGAVLIDGLGWIANELTKVLEPMLAQGGNRTPPFKILRNANWVGMQLDLISASSASEREKKEISELGLETALLAHHVPSGKLVLASGKEFADKLFAPKPGLGQDPVFLKTMKDLPMEGTALTYASPAFFSSLRQFIEKANELSNDKEHEQDDRFAVTSLLNLLLPKNARGEGRVTTNTKDGILTVSNSAHSLKNTIFAGTALPLIMGTATFTVGRQVEAILDGREHDHHDHNHRPNELQSVEPPPGNFDKKGD